MSVLADLPALVSAIYLEPRYNCLNVLLAIRAGLRLQGGESGQECCTVDGYSAVVTDADGLEYAVTVSPIRRDRVVCTDPIGEAD